MASIGDLLDSLDMESWLDQEGIRHKLTRGKSGVQLNIRECPECGNSNWKVYLNADTGVGNCFVCERKFTKWSFVRDSLKLSGSDTYSHIAKYVETQGWKPKREEPVAASKPALILPESVALPVNGRNLAYLSKRGITSELASYFGLRYCHHGVFAYKDAYGRPAAQDYSKRVIIPIYDLDGGFVSFQGRDITGTADKKYLFPPEFASTGSILYNGNKAFNAEVAVIGEGVFDCIATKAAMDMDASLNTYTAVASFGKQLGPEQVEKLKRLKTEGKLRRVIFLWDGEAAATHSAIDAGLACIAAGLQASLARLPKDCDPNEVAPEVVNNAVRNAVPITRMSAIQMRLEARRI